MNPLDDVSQEYLEAFLQEADEQLELLDRNFVILEKEGVSPDLIEEIFRVAHTLKSSSAMLGYERMSSVAHAMETVLDSVRYGTLEVSTRVIDALLQGHDILKLLREEIVCGEDSGVDIKAISDELEEVLIESTNPAKAEVVEAKTPEPEELLAEGDDSVSLELDTTVSPDSEESDSEKICTSQESGYYVYGIKIEVDHESCWAAVRCFQVLQELSHVGEVIKSIPSVEDIKAGKVGPCMKLLLSSLQDADAIRNELGSVPELIDVQIGLCGSEDEIPVIEDNAVEEAAVDTCSPEPIKPHATQKAAQVSQTVRVDVKLLDRFMNLVGEMVIDRNRIGQLSKVLETKYGEDEAVRALGETSTHSMKVMNELQESILKARMLPIGTVFNTFPRLVRDMAEKAGKKVDFIVEGRETELDRTIIEQIRDPLVHLLRNAVDHGIESAEERKVAGKAENGSVRLSAYQEQNCIVIVVGDDGGGIDANEVRAAVVNKGFKAAEDVARTTDIEAMNLIFIPGVSTSRAITEMSGRGVGLDVVRTNIENLGGSLVVESTVGQGTKFTIRLPLTLATISGLLVSSEDDVYVIPMASTVEVLRVAEQEVTTVMGRDIIRVRDDILPMIRLDTEFGRQGVEPNSLDDTFVAVVRGGRDTVALVVDYVMEPQEVVVKSLGKYVGSVRGIAGATILGDGRVALILDTASLVREANEH